MDFIGRATRAVGNLLTISNDLSVSEKINAFDYLPDEVLLRILHFTQLNGTKMNMVCRRFKCVSLSASEIKEKIDNGEIFLKKLDAGAISLSEFKRTVNFVLDKIESNDEEIDIKLLDEILRKSFGMAPFNTNGEDLRFFKKITDAIIQNPEEERFSLIKELIDPKKVHTIPIKTRKSLTTLAILQLISEGHKVNNKIKQLLKSSNPIQTVGFIGWALKNKLEKLAVTYLKNATREDTIFLLTSECFSNSIASIEFIKANSPFEVTFDERKFCVGNSALRVSQNCEFLKTFNQHEVTTASNHFKIFLGLLLTLALAIAVNRVAIQCLN